MTIRQVRIYFDAILRALFAALAESNAIIESNPTSNVAVLGLPGFEYSPFWGLLAQTSRCKPSTGTCGVRVLLGTDDPGLCCTSIDEEYDRLSSSYKKRQEIEKNDRERKVYPPHLRIGTMKWRDIEQKIRKLTREFALVKYEAK